MKLCLREKSGLAHLRIGDALLQAQIRFGELLGEGFIDVEDLLGDRCIDLGEASLQGTVTSNKTLL